MAPEPVLVDPGPATVRPRVRAALRELGVDPADIRHLCLTHVHLDHAGSAGDWAADNPRLTVHVHEEAAPHLVDPERLVASTRRTFGEAHDRLWGPVRPLPPHAVRAWRPGDRGPLSRLRALPTPGHIGHHLAYLDEDLGTLLAGDAMGIVLAEGAPVHPPTPPPAVDVAAWLGTLREVQAVAPQRAGVAHFGLHDAPAARAGELAEALTALAVRVRSAIREGRVEADARAYEQETVARLTPYRPGEEAARYFAVFSAENDYRGMARWVARNPDWRGT
ncbi:MAG: MBL fold metallo-hydrolase [Longimicrobiales bacterium]|nr:MBL fold metallo-hydrolase [Longimicrobiales bacterium]